MKKYILICALMAVSQNAFAAPKLTKGQIAYEKRDYKAALPLLKSECDKNNQKSCTSLGLIYASEVSGYRDDKKAVALYQKACDSKYFLACTELAFQYQTGNGLEQSNGKANEFYELACNNGDGEACFYAAETMTYLWDEYDEIWDNEILYDYYQKGCKLNSEDSCEYMADHLENGWGVKANHSLAIETYKKAAKLGSKSAADALKKLGQ